MTIQYCGLGEPGRFHNICNAFEWFELGLLSVWCSVCTTVCLWYLWNGLCGLGTYNIHITYMLIANIVALLKTCFKWGRYQ